MDKEKIIEKVMRKREYSQLPKKDVERVLEKFSGKNLSDGEIVKSARKFLMENYSGFGYRKLLVKSVEEKGAEWVLKKHLSTRERFPHYLKIYRRVLEGMKSEISIIDLGCGVNGLSFTYLLEAGFKPKYAGIEAMGQFVEKTNKYFEKKGFDGKVFHGSLMEMDKIKEVMDYVKKPRVVFMFKVIDSLESMERNYSKKLILSMKKDVQRFVVSFPTKSMIKREKIWAKRTWFLEFVKENFDLIDNFEKGDEKYFVFE